MKARNGAPAIERRRMTLLTRVPLRGNQRAETEDRGRVEDPRLTPRQRQVLDGLIRGLTNKEIGGELGIGPDAVKRVISRLLLKLDAPSRTALVRPALQTDAARRRRSRAPSALSILDAVPVPALITRGSAHRVEYANVAAKSILPDAGSGIELAQLFGAEPRRAVGRIADESFVSAAPGVARSVMLADLVRFGSTWRRADVFTTPMHDGAGKLAGLIVFLVDVTNDPPLRGSSPANAPSQLERERPA
ncbi:MAG TPA: LuxR C-terminal-related transcriptional regulator [Candidatus Limnocylindria bacterium]